MSYHEIPGILLDSKEYRQAVELLAKQTKNPILPQFDDKGPRQTIRTAQRFLEPAATSGPITLLPGHSETVAGA